MESLFSPAKFSPDDQDAARVRKSTLLNLLNRLDDLLIDLGDNFSGAAMRSHDLRERLLADRFHLAVLGQFKRGKSTLINALIGAPLLPMSVLPLTSIPTFLSAGPHRLIRIFFLDGKREEFPDLAAKRAAEILADYVTEERNPANKLGVSRAEVEHPCNLLTQEIVIIDTPGIGSTFRHNTEATLAFLPQCDAAIFVVSADPPITNVEVEFLKAVQAKVSRLFFVMNKADYLDADERNRAVDFFTKVLGELVKLDDNDPVFYVSARQGLQAKLNQDEALWRTSGMAVLETRLLDFINRDKARTLQFALARKTVDLVADVMMHIHLQLRSLQLPVADLEGRIQILDEKLVDAERERVALRDLLAGDRKRIMEFLEQQAAEVRQQARTYLESVVSDTLQKVDSTGLMMKKVQDRLAQKIPIFFEEKLRALSDAIDARVRQVLKPYQEKIDFLIETVRRVATDLFDIPYHAPDSAGAFERKHKPYWVTYNWNTMISPIPEGFLDRFLPARFGYRRIRQRLFEDVAALSLHNVENVRWAILQNVEDTFRRFAAELDERLEQTIEAIRRATQSARLRRKDNLENVLPELRRLEGKESAFVEIEKALGWLRTDEK